MGTREVPLIGIDLSASTGPLARTVHSVHTHARRGRSCAHPDPLPVCAAHPTACPHMPPVRAPRPHSTPTLARALRPPARTSTTRAIPCIPPTRTRTATARPDRVRRPLARPPQLPTYARHPLERGTLTTAYTCTSDRLHAHPPRSHEHPDLSHAHPDRSHAHTNRSREHPDHLHAHLPARARILTARSPSLTAAGTPTCLDRAPNRSLALDPSPQLASYVKKFPAIPPVVQEVVTRWGTFIKFHSEQRDEARKAVGLPASKRAQAKKAHAPTTVAEPSERMETDYAPSTAPTDLHTHTAWVASLRPGQRGYADVPASQWPSGLRQVVDGQAVPVPRNIGHTFLEPHEGDAAAAATARRLAPLRQNQDKSSNIRRQEFYRVWWGLFNTPGLFARIIKALSLTPGDRVYENFPYETRNLDVIVMARWALDHNITPGSRMVANLEEFAPHTIARQQKLADFPQRSLDEWGVELLPQIREAHTLRYPPLIPETDVITTSSEVQLLSRALPATVPTASASVPPVAPTAPTPSAEPEPSSAGTDTAATAASLLEAPGAPVAQDVDMEAK
ncbi:hypothetical protein FIBSPDRAFT_899140 [Athelia psychrophila]|uniref:Uncharacterized protein n=1 Tax=Athelia psychrophila TaxID=1759441 RepID=A0A166A4Y9_9AGAM|nr:hypothetical protein FIBSPDRAFT_899140 [Fibularhizoctonia sp. CBS 109695]